MRSFHWYPWSTGKVAMKKSYLTFSDWFLCKVGQKRVYWLLPLLFKASKLALKSLLYTNYGSRCSNKVSKFHLIPFFPKLARFLMNAYFELAAHCVVGGVSNVYVCLLRPGKWVVKKGPKSVYVVIECLF